MAVNPTEAFELLFTREQIVERIKQIAEQVDQDFHGSRLVVVGVLKGAFLFAADLIRELTTETEIDFIWLSSYGTERFSAGEIRVQKDLELPIRGRDVLVVEDIVDTGLSLKFLKQHLMLREPARLAFAGLVDKKAARMTEVSIDYVGFEVAQGFLVGYGMDDAGLYRGLPEIYRLPPIADK